MELYAKVRPQLTAKIVVAGDSLSRLANRTRVGLQKFRRKSFVVAHREDSCCADKLFQCRFQTPGFET